MCPYTQQYEETSLEFHLHTVSIGKMYIMNALPVLDSELFRYYKTQHQLV